MPSGQDTIGRCFRARLDVAVVEHSNRGLCQERQHFESSPRILGHAAIPLLTRRPVFTVYATDRSCATLNSHSCTLRTSIPERGAGRSFSHDQHDGKDPQAPAGAWKAGLVPGLHIGHGNESSGACIWSKHMRCRCPLMTSNASDKI